MSPPENPRRDAFSIKFDRRNKIQGDVGWFSQVIILEH
jgi:hypothetical protein